MGPGEAGEAGQGGEAGGREEGRYGGEGRLGRSECWGEGSGGQQGRHWGLEGSPPSSGHQTEGGVWAAEAGGEGAHGRADGGGSVRGVGQAVGADLLILPPLGTAVLEPDLDPGLSQPDLHG